MTPCLMNDPAGVAVSFCQGSCKSATQNPQSNQIRPHDSYSDIMSCISRSPSSPAVLGSRLCTMHSARWSASRTN